METNDSLPGQNSRVFQGIVGRTVLAENFSKADYLIDRTKYPSEGNWAFCRFDNDLVPAARMGFQVGGFNVGPNAKPVDPNFLQLHLELMTKNGAILWLASGQYSAADVRSDPRQFDIEFAPAGNKIFSLRGWPEVRCHFRSDDGQAEAALLFDLKTVTVLPDCVLPQSVFAMWESMGTVQGRVRYQNEETPVSGKVFFDHPRLREGPNPVAPRKMYVYTTMYFDDGSCIYGYHAVDDLGRPIAYYCFGIYVDKQGRGRFLNNAQTVSLSLDADNIPDRWALRWAGEDVSVQVDIAVKHDEILRAWGSPNVPKSRKDYIIMALVLTGTGHITVNGKQNAVTGKGIAEFFDVALWTG